MGKTILLAIFTSEPARNSSSDPQAFANGTCLACEVMPYALQASKRKKSILTVMVRVPAGVAPLEEEIVPATVTSEPAAGLVGVTVWAMVVVAGPTGRLKVYGGTVATKAGESGV